MTYIEKYFFLIVLMGCLCLPSVGQSTPTSTLTGQVVEFLTGEPFQYVEVLLFWAEDSISKRGVVTDQDGKFSFDGLESGKYRVVANFVGYVAKEKKFNLNGNTDIGKLTLESIYTAEETVIEGKKAAYTVKANKKSYSVAEDLLSQTGSLTDVLRNIPSLSVGINGQVSLRGTSNITYLINGRPSALLRANPQAVISQIPANSIERIEVITSPSAKYRADGAGGIINIVLKKGLAAGLNATLQVNAGNLDRRNVGLNANYGQNNLNVFGNYSFRNGTTPRDVFDIRIERDGKGGLVSLFDTKGVTSFGTITHMASAGINTNVGKKGYFELEGNYIYINNNNLSQEDWLVNDEQVREFTLTRDYRGFEQEYELGAVYEYIFSPDHELAVEVALAAYDEEESNDYIEKYTNPELGSQESRNLLLKGGPQLEVAVDYVVPVGKEGELETGYFGQFIRDDIRSKLENYQNESWVNDTRRSSEFLFDQHVHALYGVYTHGFDMVSVSAGMRAEQALITSNLITTNTVIPNNYFRLYPSVNITYEIDDFSNYFLNYSKRVNRADPDEQNPFPEYKTPRERDAGNPNLLPEQIHSIELGMIRRFQNLTFAPTLFYRHTFDAFTEFWEIQEDSILHTSFTNTGFNRAGGFEFALIGDLKKRLQYNWSSTIFYNEIDGSNLGLPERTSNVTWETKLNLQAAITRSTFFQLNAHYQSERLTPQGAFRPIFLLNTGLRQDVFKKRASIVATVSDVFASLIVESVVDTDQLYRKINYGRNRQIFQIGFVYNFRHTGKRKSLNLDFEDNIEETKLPTQEED